MLRLHQKRPAYVVQIGEMDPALDKEITDEIYIKAIGGGNHEQRCWKPLLASLFGHRPGPGDEGHQ